MRFILELIMLRKLLRKSERWYLVASNLLSLPTGLISEISRLEDVNGIPKYDEHLENSIHNLSKIVLSQTNDKWLLKLRDADKLTEVLLTESLGCGSDEITEIMAESIDTLILESEHLPDRAQPA
jgi:hypothetical protein